MSSDRMKRHQREDALPGKGAYPHTHAAKGRYVRFSWRYNSWQTQCPVTHQWKNIRPELARAYVAAGLRVGVQA